MKTRTEIILTAASIVDPALSGGPFAGTRTEALRAMVEWAADIRSEHQGDAHHKITTMLRHSRPDLVAEMCASALLALTNTL